MRLSSLRVGLLHLAPELGAVDANRSLIERATIQAAELGAEWVISGELVVCGYHFEPMIGTDWITTEPGDWMARFADLTASLGVVSFLSHPEREAATGKLFNTMFVLGRNGQLLGSQRKLHPIPVSEDWSQPGTLASPITVDDVNVGLLVCADAHPPDHAADLRDAGAELLVSSAAWWPGQWGPHGEWEDRTTETDLPMIVCNRTGTDGPAQLAKAESVVIDRGQRLLALSSPASSLFMIDCKFTDGHITSSTATEVRL